MVHALQNLAPSVYWETSWIENLLCACTVLGLGL